MYPTHTLRLLCADYAPSDVEALDSDLRALLSPKTSHMDFNIACALHFASKGEGYLVRDEYFMSDEGMKGLALIEGAHGRKAEAPGRDEEVKRGNSKAKSYDYGMITEAVSRVDPGEYRGEEWVRSKSKVVLSGLGADEVFCGYARYKTAFERGGIKEMDAEMSLDLDRLWHRNMGRDDRAISDNGKEARFPFLDVNLMRYLGQHVDSSDLVDWTAFRGLGDK